MIGHIFKYQIPISDNVVEIELPEHHQYCDIQEQGESIFLWCMVDIHAPLVKKKFRVFGTGHKIDNAEDYYFIKTVQMNNSGFVWHVFEVIE